MTSLHVICGLGPPPQTKILATPMHSTVANRTSCWMKMDRLMRHDAINQIGKQLALYSDQRRKTITFDSAEKS